EVEGAEDRRRRDRLWRRVLPAADLDAVAERAPGDLDHARAPVDAAVVDPERDQMTAEPAVAAGEVEHLVTGGELRAVLDHEPRAARVVPLGVGVVEAAVLLRDRVVLRDDVAHRAFSRSGCLRTNRTTPAQCQSVRRVSQRLSVSALCSWRTTAPGT